MATAKEMALLIEAVRRIAKTDDEIRSTINAAALRGDIPETEVRADIADSQDECCAEKGNGGGGNDGPCDTPAGDIWCNPDTPWVDCKTGQPVRINFGGFPQSESCKECGPDETWIEGQYIRAYVYTAPLVGGAVFTYEYFPTEAGVRQWMHDNLGCLENPEVDPLLRTDVTSAAGRADLFCPSTYGGAYPNFGWGFATFNCSSTYISSVCDLTEAPEVCGDNWDDDGVVDLANVGGCLIGSKCDNNASSADQKCQVCRDICGPAGQKLRVCAKPHSGGATVEDPSNPGYGSSYDRYGSKLYDYNPLGG